MKHLAGVLCCACFLSCFVAYLVDPPKVRAHDQREVSQDHTVLAGSARKDRAQAVRLEVATYEGCHYCELFKQTTLPRLEAAGHKVTLTDGVKRGVTFFPTLHYIGQLGQVTHIDVGYRTYVQVTKHLRKP